MAQYGIGRPSSFFIPHQPQYSYVSGVGSDEIRLAYGREGARTGLTGLRKKDMVEPRGIEPLTSTVRLSRSPN